MRFRLPNRPGSARLRSGGAGGAVSLFQSVETLVKLLQEKKDLADGLFGRKDTLLPGQDDAV
jgi:hypothetical protein